MKQSTKNIAIIIGVPVAYALAITWIFGLASWSDLYSVMSITFLFLSPTIIGALAVFLSRTEDAENAAYCICVPWIPVFLFVLITLLFSIEGWGCWIMVLPFFLFTASIGGLIGGYFKTRRKRGKVYLSVLALLPFFISPIEKIIGAIPGTYEAYTYIDITSSPEKIWSNVTRVKEIPQEQDRGTLTKFLRFPRPVKAELDFRGVGARREAIFSMGLVFHETVLEYSDMEKMVFSIKANRYEIPSTTFDEHVTIGGEYFDVLSGTYRLQKLNDSKYRLHLYSNFKLTTTFNFYASWWARWIMEDIQNNILQVIKARAEKK